MRRFRKELRIEKKVNHYIAWGKSDIPGIKKTMKDVLSQNRKTGKIHHFASFLYKPNNDVRFLSILK